MGMARSGDRDHPCRLRQRRRHCRRPKRCHRFLGGYRPECRHAADRHRRLSLVWADLGRGGHRPDQPAAIQPDRRGDWARPGRGGSPCARGWRSSRDSDHLPAIAWSVDCGRPDSRPGGPAAADRDSRRARISRAGAGFVDQETDAIARNACDVRHLVDWHVVVQVQTLAVTIFTSPWEIVPAMGLAFAGLFTGGVIFALLRLRTRNLAAAVVAHWLFDAGLITGLFFLTR